MKLLLCFFSAALVPSLVLGECDQCQFDGNDADGCFDYGLIDNTEVVPWPLGTQGCKDTYKIKIDSPNADSVCASSSSFVNDMRFGSLQNSQALLGVGVSDGGFFEQDESNGSLINIKDTITIDGKTIDCKSSESNCYNGMKPYFDTAPGKSEKDDICSTLYNQVKVNSQLEQSTLRTRLCEESRAGETIPSSCEPLLATLETKLKEYSSKACSGFAFGVGSKVIPGCEGVAAAGTQTPTSGASNLFFGGWAMAVGVWWALA